MSKSNYIVRGGADFSGIKKEIQATQKQLNSFQSSVGKAFKVALGYIGIRAIAGFTKEMTKWGSDVAEIQNVVNVTFGSMSKDIEDFSKTAMEGFGLSELYAKKYSSTMGAMLKSSGLTGDAVRDMSIDLTKLTADLASFHNISTDEAFKKIMSGMAGMSRPLKDIGINMNIANLEAFAMSQGIKKSWQQMSQAEQQMLRYKYLLSVTGDVQGDFARNSHNWAHSLKVLKSQWETLKATIGQGFINVLQHVVTWMNAVIKRIQILAEYFRAFTAAIFGNTQASRATGAGLGYVAEALGDTGDELGDVGKAGKKAGKDLMGFDEINQMAEAGGAGDLADELGGIGDIDLGSANGGVFDAISEKATEMAEKVKGALDKLKNVFDEVKGFIKTNSDSIIGCLGGILGGFLVLKTGASAHIMSLSGVLGLLIGNIIYLWQTNENFKNSILEVWEKIKETVTTIVIGMWNIIKGVWVKYGDSLITNLAGFMKSIQTIIITVWEGFLRPIIMGALEMLSWLWTEHLSGLIQQIGEFVMILANGALEIWNRFISPIANWMAQTFGPVIANVIKLAIDVIGSLLAGVIDIAAGLIKVLGGIIEFIVGVFTLDWRKAWDGVKQIFKGIMDTLYGIVKVPLNLIIDAINTVIRGLNKISIKIPDWVPGFGGKSWGINISTIPKLARGGIIDRPTLAMVGESGKEAVVPLENTGFVDAIASAVGSAVLAAMNVTTDQSSGSSGDIVLNIDGRTFGRLVKPYIDQESKRIGADIRLNPI